jgi:hypothetical protein
LVGLKNILHSSMHVDTIEWLCTILLLRKNCSHFRETYQLKNIFERLFMFVINKLLDILLQKIIAMMFVLKWWRFIWDDSFSRYNIIEVTHECLDHYPLEIVEAHPTRYRWNISGTYTQNIALLIGIIHKKSFEVVPKFVLNTDFKVF